MRILALALAVSLAAQTAPLAQGTVVVAPVPNRSSNDNSAAPANIRYVDTAISSRAPKESPAFSGTMTLPTPGKTIFSGNGAGIDIQFGPNAEISARPGGLPQFDAIRSMVTVGPGRQSVGQVSAVAGTVRGRVAAGGANNNGFPVGIFGNATCEVNGCNVWSLNTTASDSGNNTIDPAATGRVIQNEFDMNVFNQTTVAKGVSTVLNAFTSGVTSTFAFIAEKNTHSPPWAQGFSTGSGAASAAFVAGESAKSGSNISSQPFVFNYFDATGAQASARLLVIPGAAGVRLTQTGGDGFQAPNLFLPNGGQVQISNGTIGAAPITALTADAQNRLTLGLSALQVVVPTQIVPDAANTRSLGTPTLPFGSVAAASYYAGSVVGVSCNGPPTNQFKVTNGIVTHC